MRLRRLIAFGRKEFLQMVRDPSSALIAFVQPLLLLLLFGYGISLDLREIGLALVVEEPSERLSEITAPFFHNPTYRPREASSLQQGERWLERGEVKALLYLRHDFTRRLKAQLLVDGIDANSARIVEGYLVSTLAAVVPFSDRRLEPRVWFNETVESRRFLIPGILGVIMTLVGGMLTALVVAREWERGTIEFLLASPISRFELLLGKTVPYFLFGTGSFLFSLTLALFLFKVPFRGSFPFLWLGASLFLLTTLAIGLFISASTRNQFLASQLTLLTTLLPAYLLSGLLFEISSMPRPIQLLTYLVPARYFVPILKGEFLAGHVPSLFWSNASVLAFMALLFLTLTFLKLGRSLE